MKQTKRLRCDNCNRVIYKSDMLRGLAHAVVEMYGYGDQRIVGYHNYPCRLVSRRLTWLGNTPEDLVRQLMGAK